MWCALAEGGSRWCPEERAGIWSRLLFTWVNPLMAKGASKQLGPEDLWDTLPEDETQRVSDEFHRHLAASKRDGAKQVGWWKWCG